MSHVQLAIDDGIASLTINRPHKRNALNGDVIRELVTHLNALRNNPDARVIVLTGAGDKSFSSGGDLSTMPDGGMLAMHNEREGFIDLILAMQRCGTPIIGRVNGHALAGGLGLMLACDLVVAADDVTFGTPEIKVGLFPMMIMTLIFRNIGRKKGMELILTGKRLSAAEAQTLGLINEAVPRAELDTAVAQLAERIAGFSPAILKLGRDAFYTSSEMEFTAALQYLRSQLTLNTMTEDASVGIMSFLGKQKPEWKGR